VPECLKRTVLPAHRERGTRPIPPRRSRGLLWADGCAESLACGEGSTPGHESYYAADEDFAAPPRFSSGRLLLWSSPAAVAKRQGCRRGPETSLSIWKFSRRGAVTASLSDPIGVSRRRESVDTDIFIEEPSRGRDEWTIIIRCLLFVGKTLPGHRGDAAPTPIAQVVFVGICVAPLVEGSQSFFPDAPTESRVQLRRNVTKDLTSRGTSRWALRDATTARPRPPWYNSSRRSIGQGEKRLRLRMLEYCRSNSSTSVSAALTRRLRVATRPAP